MALNVRFLQKAGDRPGGGRDRHGSQRRRPARSSTSCCCRVLRVGRAVTRTASDPARARCLSASRSRSHCSGSPRDHRGTPHGFERTSSGSCAVPGRASSRPRSPVQARRAVRRFDAVTLATSARSRRRSRRSQSDVTFAQVGAVYLGHRSSRPRRRPRAGSAPWRPRGSPASPAWASNPARRRRGPQLPVRDLLAPDPPGWMSFRQLQQANMI